jgi:hypothetical protein
MGFAIYAKKDEKATNINSIFNLNFNFTSFNKTLNKLINFRVIDNNITNSDSVVSANIVYLDIGDDYYTSDGNLIVALDDGIVTYVNGKGDDYTIIVEYDCGVRATFNNVNEVNVYVNDRIYQDDILGSFSEKVKMIFIKDSKKIVYEEVLALI